MGCVVAYDTVPSDPRDKDGSIPLHTAIESLQSAGVAAVAQIYPHYAAPREERELLPGINARATVVNFPFEGVRQFADVPGHRLSSLHAMRLEGPSTYSPSSPRASAAAPSTPDAGPRLASFISTRSREGERALSCTSLRAGSRISSPALEAPPPTGITSGLKMFTNPARPMPSHRPVSSRTEMDASSPS